MKKEQQQTPLNIGQEIFALLDSLNCKHLVRSGIVFVQCPDGSEWDFFIPHFRKDSSGYFEERKKSK